MKKNQLLLFTLITLIVITGFTSCNNSKEKVAPLIDVKLFFKNGEKDNFQISPNGQYYSYVKNHKDYLNVYVQKVDDKESVRVTNDTARNIGNYLWKGDRIVYLQDLGGNENYQLFSVDCTGKDLKALTPFPGCRTDILDDLHFVPGKEKEMLILFNKRDKQYSDPYLINIETGELKLMYENKQKFDRWITDNNGTIRMVAKIDGVNISYFYRNNENDAFKELITISFKESFDPQAFDAANKNIYVLSNIGRDKIALTEYDPVAKKEVKELFAQPDYDLSGIFYDRKKKMIANVYWMDEKPQDYYFDKQRDTIISNLLKQFEGYKVYFTSCDDEMKTGIVAVNSDRLPVKYYTCNFISGESKEISNPYPWINENDMAPMKLITYTARDGMIIHGYLTLPKGIKAKKLPVVIFPHGGPHFRNWWGCDLETQFLANRGYAVLQMNFRGSSGYGKQFWMASFKQMGKKMQDDITDGVEYLKKEGIADPKRIAIYGYSYGGYAALAGVAFTPDLYNCAIEQAGISNLFTFIKSTPPNYSQYLDLLYETIGNPVKDSLLLAESSPVLHSDQIKVPLLIAQGLNDPRVNKSESDQMVDALKKRGIEVEYMVKNDEGHLFQNQNNRIEFYGAMEKFLNKHMKAKK